MNDLIYVDGNAVPSQITTLIRQGRWRPPAEMSVWYALIPRECVFQPTFYEIARLNGRSIWESDAGDDCVGVCEDGINPGAIDPSQAIIIGDLGPERLLALDLRTSPTNPSVCALVPREDAESCWIQIAPNLDEFLQALGIV
jgi:hypothetical protein